MRNYLTILSVLLCWSGFADVLANEQQSGASAAAASKLQIEIQSPSANYVASSNETIVEVEGIASAIGGVRYLDMIFVMDTSQSLRKTDPDDYRSAGAIGLVESLSPRSDIQIGVVGFSRDGDLFQPMTSERDRVVDVLRHLPRSGSTDLAAGIRAALKELDVHGRPGSSRVIMLFTDGKSNEKKGLRSRGEVTAQRRHDSDIVARFRHKGHVYSRYYCVGDWRQLPSGQGPD